MSGVQTYLDFWPRATGRDLTLKACARWSPLNHVSSDCLLVWMQSMRSQRWHEGLRRRNGKSRRDSYEKGSQTIRIHLSKRRRPTEMGQTQVGPCEGTVRGLSTKNLQILEKDERKKTKTSLNLIAAKLSWAIDCTDARSAVKLWTYVMFEFLAYIC